MLFSKKRLSPWTSYVTGKKTVTELYDQLVRKGIISFDKDQRIMAESCAPLISLINECKVNSTFTSENSHSDTNHRNVTKFRYMLYKIKGFISKVMQGSMSNGCVDTVGNFIPVCLGAVEKRGLYIWGPVGGGKTMILDLFAMCDLALPKRRSHLHSFITDISNRLVKAELYLRERRLASEQSGAKVPLASISPMDLVVQEILRESPILFFDEFQTFDVAHAAILSHFLTSAFAKGLFFITTSNRSPEDICKISSSFTQFLPILRTYCHVLHLENTKDYRYKPANEHCHESVFVYPHTKTAVEHVLQRLNSAIKVSQGRALWIKDYGLWHHGRCMVIPYYANGVAIFDFSDICGGRQDLSSIDFALLAHHSHTVFITNIPQISTASRNVSHQFIILVDELYQNNVKLLFTSQVPWHQLLASQDCFAKFNVLSSSTNYYTEGEDERSGYAAAYNFQNQEEIISFTRIKSRLQEMGCRSYLLRQHKCFVVSDFDFHSLVE